MVSGDGTGRRPIAALASGKGSNLQAILDASDHDPHFGADVVVVVSERAEAAALNIARRAGIPTATVPWESPSERDVFTKAICAEAEAHDATAIVLAGFMKILGPEAMARFPNAILNTHPSLLPAFPGAHAVREALRHGVGVTGCTVHFVDEEVDHGPIIAQEPVAVLADDDETTLHGRIKAVEHRLYPEVIKAFANGQITVAAGRAIWKR